MRGMRDHDQLELRRLSMDRISIHEAANVETRFAARAGAHTLSKFICGQLFPTALSPNFISPLVRSRGSPGVFQYY